MKIEMHAMDAIKPYENNPRKNDSAVDAVAKSLKTFGFRQPIVVDAAGVIVVGHTRWKAAQQLGLSKVPVHVATDLTPEQAKAYRIADNQTNSIAEWDMELLPLELTALKDLNFDLSTLGFDEDELSRLLKAEMTDGLIDPDSVPEPPDKPITQKGDLWVLDRHRLLCGDSSSVADLDRLLEGESVHLVNTDPPYNVNVSPRTGTAIAAGTCHGLPQEALAMQQYDKKRGAAAKPKEKMRARDRALQNDFMTSEQFDKVLAAWFSNITHRLIEGGSFYIWGGFGTMFQYGDAIRNNEDMHFAQAIIWTKSWPVLGRKDFMCDHEWCFYGWKAGAAHRFFGPNNIPDVWPVKKVNPQNMIHLTEKPVELAARAIQYSSQPGENVLDFFGGSGSTLIAAEQMGRQAFLMELDCLYADVIVTRWEQFTGKKAERIAAKDAKP